MNRDVEHWSLIEWIEAIVVAVLLVAAGTALLVSILNTLPYRV